LLKDSLTDLKRKHMKTILLVDDDSAVLTFHEFILNDLGYDVISKHEAKSALSLIREGVNIDLVITDFQMPGMNGVEFISQLRLTLPFVPVLMLSGYCDVNIDPSLDVFKCIEKPVERKELGHIVKAALDRSDAKEFRYDVISEKQI